MKRPALPSLPALNVKSPFLWAAVTFLLLLGMLTTIVDLAGVPKTETLHANATQQRIIIDPVTGMVSGMREAGGNDEKKPFDVSADDVKLPAEAEEHATEATSEPEAEHAAVTTPEPKQAQDDSALPAGLTPLRTSAPNDTIATVARSSDSLVTAPAPEVSKKSSDGMILPIHGKTDATPASIYAQPFARAVGQGRVAILVMDVGVSPSTVPLLLSLPRQVSVAVSPYTRSNQKAIEQLRNHGMETWAILPTMTERYPQADPGPLGLISNMPRDEQLRRLHEAMSATLGSVGFVLPIDENYSAHPDAFAPILKDITDRGMLLLTTHPTRSIAQVSPDAALRESIRRADFLLDPVPNDALIRSKLAGLAASLTGKTDTIILVSSRPQSLLILSEWLKTNPLPAPLTLAPLSAIYAHDKPKAEPVEEKSDAHGAAPAASHGAEKPAAASGHH